MPRRKSTGGAAHVGDVLPPPPAIPEPQMTEAEIAKQQAQRARMLVIIKEIEETMRERNLASAVVLAQMAYRRQGPLVEFFAKLGATYRKLADEGPQRTGLGLKVIKGGAD